MVRSEHLTLLEPCTYTPLQASLDAFLLSKQAARCTAKTLVHYRYTVGGLVSFLQGQRVIELERITPNHVRRFLVELQRYLALAGEDIERAHVAHSPVDRLLDSR